MAYATLAQVKAELGITATTDDTLFNDLIPEAKAAIDLDTGRTFEAAADSTRYFDADRDVCDDRRTLWLRDDLCAITTVTNGDSVAVSSTERVTEPRNTTPYYAIKLLSSSGKTWTYTDDAENAITIVGRWAYSTTPPAAITRACVRLVAYWYRLKDSQVFDVTADPESGQIIIPKGLPADVKRILDPYRRLS